jgi:hypothetical protein
MRVLLAVSIACLTLTSCASFAGLGGKAHYVQTFEDTEASTVAEDGTVAPGQTTKYSLDIKGPAGMKWEEITSMSYTWSPTQGAIGVNSASKGDTLATAEAIKQVVPALTESIGSAVSAGIIEALKAYLPYDIQKTQIKADAGIRETEIKADTVKEVVKVVAPKPAENPVVDIIPTPGNPPVAPPLGPNN